MVRAALRYRYDVVAHAVVRAAERHEGAPALAQAHLAEEAIAPKHPLSLAPPGPATTTATPPLHRRLMAAPARRVRLMPLRPDRHHRHHSTGGTGGSSEPPPAASPLGFSISVATIAMSVSTPAHKRSSTLKSLSNLCSSSFTARAPHHAVTPWSTCSTTMLKSKLGHVLRRSKSRCP